jgi:hypothetical protein
MRSRDKRKRITNAVDIYFICPRMAHASQKQDDDKYTTKLRGEHKGVTNVTNIFLMNAHFLPQKVMMTNSPQNFMTNTKEQRMWWIYFTWVPEMMS